MTKKQTLFCLCRSRGTTLIILTSCLVHSHCRFLVWHFLIHFIWCSRQCKWLLVLSLFSLLQLPTSTFFCQTSILATQHISQTKLPFSLFYFPQTKYIIAVKSCNNLNGVNVGKYGWRAKRSHHIHSSQFPPSVLKLVSVLILSVVLLGLFKSTVFRICAASVLVLGETVEPYCGKHNLYLHFASIANHFAILFIVIPLSQCVITRFDWQFDIRCKFTIWYTVWFIMICSHIL